MGCAKDGEGRGRPHARAGRQSRPRIGVKPFGNGQFGPIALSLGLPWDATQGCASLRALGPTCRVRTRDLSTDKLLGALGVRKRNGVRTRAARSDSSSDPGPVNAMDANALHGRKRAAQGAKAKAKATRRAFATQRWAFSAATR